MAYDENLARRLRAALADQEGLDERKMFGGLALMLRGNMCCGVIRDELMLRVGPARYEATLARPHARMMDFTGRPMKGMVMVSPAGFVTEQQLAEWVALAVAFAGSLPAK
jgi:TfoX/Sxy family transcriptional regulator of competence genes